MSNELILSIQNSLAGLEMGLDEDTLAVAGSGGGKRISIKGGVFRKIVNGKEVGTIEDRHMNIIFVKLAHDPARTYYDQGFVEGEKISPLCWSSNAKTPDADVKTPQSKTCDKCQWSVKGTGTNGKGTACRLSWRTAVVLPTDPSGDVMQLVIPAASVFGDEESGRWPFRSYVQMLASHNISAGRVVTKMSFDTKASAPRVLFSPVGAIQPEDVSAVALQSKSTEAEKAIKLTVFHRDEQAAIVEAEGEDAPEVKQPELPRDEATESVEEPKLREPISAAPVVEKDVSAVIAKWSKKKA